MNGFSVLKHEPLFKDRVPAKPGSNMADTGGREKDVKRVAQAIRVEQKKHRTTVEELDAGRTELLAKLERRDR